jgi:hypothetical protein
MYGLRDVSQITPGAFCIGKHPCEHPNTTIRLHNGDVRIVDLTGADMETLSLFLPSSVFEGEVAHFSGLFALYEGRRATPQDATKLIRRVFGQPEPRRFERLTQLAQRLLSCFKCSSATEET